MQLLPSGENSNSHLWSTNFFLKASRPIYKCKTRKGIPFTPPKATQSLKQRITHNLYVTNLIKNARSEERIKKK